MSRIGVYGGAPTQATTPSAELNKINRGAALRSSIAIDAGQAKRERSLDQLDAPTVEEELSAALFEEHAGAFADPAMLRPAGVRAVLEDLQRDLTVMQETSPEDLIELALGVLEDELRNAENLQLVLQRAPNR